MPEPQAPIAGAPEAPRTAELDRMVRQALGAGATSDSLLLAADALDEAAPGLPTPGAAAHRRAARLLRDAAPFFAGRELEKAVKAVEANVELPADQLRRIAGAAIHRLYEAAAQDGPEIDGAAAEALLLELGLASTRPATADDVAKWQAAGLDMEEGDEMHSLTPAAIQLRNEYRAWKAGQS